MDEEVWRLAEVYRLPVILCCLEGRSLDEAARELGWTPGSVKGRLERGRARLQERLERRGLSVAAMTAATAAARAVPTVPPAFTAWLAVAGVATPATAVIRDMAGGRLRLAAAGLAVAGAVAAGLWTFPLWDTSDRPPAEPPAVAADALTRLQAMQQQAAGETLDVRGRVFDPDGQPLAGAFLYVGYANRDAFLRLPHVRQAAHLPRGRSDADGRFRFRVARADLDPRALDDSQPAVLAVADGFGADWAELRPEGGGARLVVRQDVPVTGRLLDPAGNPLTAATVRVLDVTTDSEAKVTSWLVAGPNHNAWTARAGGAASPGSPPA